MSEQSTKETEEQEAKQRRELARRLDAGGWALFLMWVGAFLTNLGLGVGLVAAGCASAPTAAEPALVRRLADHSITYRNTTRIVLTGSEGGYGADISVAVTAQSEFLIQQIWDTIYQSRPYDVIYFSGYRKLDFYRRGRESAPALSLLVNESEACHIEGTATRFRCPGINAILERLLKAEYEKRRRSEQGAGGDR